MTYRYIYKITCTAGSFKDKFYFGQHTTTNLDDGYKGSGILIQKYYKKHPNDFIKEIISFHNSDESLDKAEIDIIQAVLNDVNCLNIAAGGHGGFTGYHTEETKQKLSEIHKGKPTWNKGLHNSEEARKKMSEAKKGKPTWNKGLHNSEEAVKKQINSLKEYYKSHDGSFLGKKHTEEARKKMSEAKKGKHYPKLSEALKGRQAWNKGLKMK